MTVDSRPAAGLAVASPRISVIVPSFNSAPYLRQALSSALEQVPRPYEVIVQDGGSTDETLDILRSFG
jgi:glycosyltransferase involved in cell wall biosynthesis